MKQILQETQNTKDQKKPWMLLAPLLIFAVGAGIFLYPAISNFLAEKRQQGVIHTYQAQVETEDDTDLAQAWAEAETYNENLAGDPVHDPFVVGSGYVLPENYNQVLNPGHDGVMGYVEIPKIGVYVPVYHGTDPDVLEKGAGHLEATALPIGGEFRHSVISAHRGLPSAELFTRLDEMTIGDIFYIHVLDQILAYKVDQIEVIEPENLALLTPIEGRDLVTLLTCTPYAVNTHRLLVRGTRIPYDAAQNTDGSVEIDTGADRSWIWIYIVGAVVGFMLLFIMIPAVYFPYQRRKRHKGKK